MVRERRFSLVQGRPIPFNSNISGNSRNLKVSHNHFKVSHNVQHQPNHMIELSIYSYSLCMLENLRALFHAIRSLIPPLISH